MIIRLIRHLKGRCDDIMASIGYYPAETIFTLQNRHIAIADRDRAIKEQLVRLLHDYEADIGEIRLAREQVAHLPADAPPAMIEHVLETQDQIVGRMITKAEHRQVLQQLAVGQQGNWLAAQTVEEVDQGGVTVTALQ
jgi:hypothetical protein